MTEHATTTDLPQAVIQAGQIWLKEVDAALPGAVSAFYIVGSAALSAYTPGHSDVDFVSVSAQPLCPDQLPALTRTHKRAQHAAGVKLDGCMVTEAALRGQQHVGPVLRLQDGKTNLAGPWQTVSVDAHVLREYGVPLRGEPPAQHMPPADWNTLSNSMVENLNTYWRRWQTDGSHWATPKSVGLLFVPQVEWCVLGVSRIAYSLREHGVIGKTAAGQYMLSIAPERWHCILRESLRPRLGGPAQFATAFARRREALAYLGWVIDWANESVCRGW
jgi:hypothetical protein